MFNLLTRRASALLLLAAFSADAEDAPAPSSENLKYVNYYDLSWTEDPGIP